MVSTDEHSRLLSDSRLSESFNVCRYQLSPDVVAEVRLIVPAGKRVTADDIAFLRRYVALAEEGLASGTDEPTQETAE